MLCCKNTQLSYYIRYIEFFLLTLQKDMFVSCPGVTDDRPCVAINVSVR